MKKPTRHHAQAVVHWQRIGSSKWDPGEGDKIAKKTAAQASTAAWSTVDQATETLIRAQVRRIKTHPA